MAVWAAFWEKREPRKILRRETSGRLLLTGINPGVYSPQKAAATRLGRGCIKRVSPGGVGTATLWANGLIEYTGTMALLWRLLKK
jgi:hypothetical protein